MSGDSDPTTLDLFGISGKILLHQADVERKKLGLSYLTKYSKYSFINYCEFLAFLKNMKMTLEL